MTFLNSVRLSGFTFNVLAWLQNQKGNGKLYEHGLIFALQFNEGTAFHVHFVMHENPLTHSQGEVGENKNWVLSNELTSAFWIFQGGNSTFINLFDKTQSLFHSPTLAAPKFL